MFYDYFVISLRNSLLCSVTGKSSGFCLGKALGNLYAYLSHFNETKD